MSINDLSPSDREALMAARQEEYENFWPGPPLPVGRPTVAV
ncbi:hypothetical protein ABZ864_47965 [Streptomyces sp. NPDC047082]